MRRRSLFLLSIAALAVTVSADCEDVSYTSMEADFGGLKRVTRVAIGGRISAFTLSTSISDAQFTQRRQANAQPLVIYSSLSHSPVWTHVDMLAAAVKVESFYPAVTPDPPLLMFTVCEYATGVSSFDDSAYSIDSQRAGLVSMYENELTVVFRSFRSGLFFFSMAEQGDVLIAQVVHGKVEVIFDFGSLSHSRITAGRALDDGEWHEMRWSHQFDSVQLSIDGVVLNETTPSGLYRKLDLHSQVHVAGRPSDDLSPAVETTFRGCLARVQLNSVDLLAHAPKETVRKCQMPSPPSLTLLEGGEAVVPFHFLPFSFEFRVLARPAVLLHLMDAGNDTLMQITIEDANTLYLISNATRFKQHAQPAINVADGSWHAFSLRIRGARLEVDIDGFTVLWLEGGEVRKISQKLAFLKLAATGCYRTTTIDLSSVQTRGKVSRGGCGMKDRCLPNPCENGGSCTQSTLVDYECTCASGYRGKNCHTAEHPRSCEEWQWQRDVVEKERAKKRGGKVRPPSKAPRNLTLDLDGGGKLPSLNVLCQLRVAEDGTATVATILRHSETRPVYVTGEVSAGAVRRQLKYGADTPQLDRFVEGFDHCQQHMRFACRGGARLMTWGDERQPSSWYSTRSEKHGLQWADAPPYSRMCGCALNNTCLGNRMCNCDSGEDGVDEGLNTFPQLLPVTALYLGGTTTTSAVNVSIGHLECSHRVVFEPISFLDRNVRLVGSKTFAHPTFDIAMHVKFTHKKMSIFSWESADGLHWFHLYVKDGLLVGEVVNGGESVSISSSLSLADGEWHAVYWEADGDGMRMQIDGRQQERAARLVLPRTYTWTIGSRTESGQSGFAGAIRNMHLCGEEIALSNIIRKTAVRGVVLGEQGQCRAGYCRNGGRCVDRFDSFACDCDLTPFGGQDCARDYGMAVPHGSKLSIPWQNPAHVDMCHRIAIQTKSSNVSLIRSKAMFAESQFNMTINEKGHLSISAYDGFFFNHRKTFKHPMNDDTLQDIAFCATAKEFVLTVNEVKAIEFIGNWTFFQNFNVWNFLDSNFTGCVSRMRVGSSFPLKNPRASRLNHSGGIRFGSCPVDVLDDRQPLQPKKKEKDDPIHISAVSHSPSTIISITSISGLAIAIALTCILSCLVCYMRSRPEGVYKTHEEGRHQSPSSDCRSDDLLVNANNNQGSFNKEYFC